MMKKNKIANEKAGVSVFVKIAVLLIGIAIVVSGCMLVYAIINSQKNPEIVQSITSKEPEDLITSQITVVEPEEETAKPIELQNAVFMGDSLTEGLSYYKLIDAENAVCEKGITTRKAVQMLDRVVEQEPSALFILLGANDMNDYTKTLDQDIRNYKVLLDAVRERMPDTPVYVQSLLPVTRNYEKKNKNITNKNLDEFNAMLEQLCKEEAVQYIDIASEFKGKNGSLPSKDSNDGIHLTAENYKKWYRVLEEKLSSKE